MEDKRAFERIPFRKPVSYESMKEIEVEDGPKVIKGGSLSCNLSKGGLRSVLDMFVPVQTSILLNF